jgi:hypothetical protein
MRALRAPAKLSEILEAVDSRDVFISEFELKCVLPDEFDLTELETVGNVDRKNDTLARHLVLTRGARAETSKQWRKVSRFVAVFPEDLNLARAQLLNLGWRGGSRSHAIPRRVLAMWRTIGYSPALPLCG